MIPYVDHSNLSRRRDEIARDPTRRAQLARAVAVGAGRPRHPGRHHDLGRARYARRALARPERYRSVHHAVHGAVRPARRAGEADARRRQHAEPRRVVDDVQGWAHVRVRPAQGREIPQRRSGHRGGREVLVRALSRPGGQAAQGPRARGADRRSRARALPTEGAVARFHDVLRHLRDGGRVDRAEEVRREGGRGRLQEGARRRRPLQVRELQPGYRSGDGGLRGLLAQGAEREAPGIPQHARRDDAGGGAQGR